MDAWRLIVDAPASGADNMATDEAMLRAAARSATAPTLRLYGWKTPEISIGRLQDAGPFGTSGLPVVRRMTGGRAVLHDMELTYSVAAGQGNFLFDAGISGAYRHLSICIARALCDLGCDAALERSRWRSRERAPSCFSSTARHEVLSNGRKLVGSSQRRLKDAFLQHGSILLDVNPALYGRVFGDARNGRVAGLRELCQAGTEDLVRALVKRFSEGLDAGFTQGTLTPGEEALKEELMRKKYSSHVWNNAGSCWVVETEARLTSMSAT
jgi:lipoate-protein ligase A